MPNFGVGGQSDAYRALIEQGLKRCTRCKEVKPLSEFLPRVKTSTNQLPRAKCKPCSVAYVIERRDPGYHRRYRLRVEYGMTEEDYQQWLYKQDGKCAICGISESEALGGRFRVDHNHDTTKVRGLLCHSCNIGLGHLGDSIALVRKALGYLMKGV